ncbi:MAG: HEAT repeat domain-containing protein [Promethearchaeota archaeon]
MSITDLLAAISRFDFHSSSNLLLEFVREENIQVLKESLYSAFRENRNLRIRDHVAYFLALDPIYCALEMPSYDLIDIVKGIQTRKTAIQLMFEYVHTLFESQSELFNSSAVRVYMAASSPYSILLPGILQKRIQEIRDCRIPFTEKHTRTSVRQLYYIGHLRSTKYGKSILQAYSESGIESVVEKEVWTEIASILTDLGFEPESMCEEIPPDDWYACVKSLDAALPHSTLFRAGKQPRDEIEAIRRLDASIQGIEEERGPRGLTQFALLKEIKSLQTRHYNRNLVALQPTMAIRLQGVIIDILVNTRDPASEDILNALLDSKVQSERALAARGLARLNALESPISVSAPSEVDSIELAEMMSYAISVKRRQRSTKSALMVLANSKIPSVRKDLARILIELHDKDTRELFFQLLKDPEEEVGIEVVSNVNKLPVDLAQEILRVALESPHNQISTLAEEAALAFGNIQP